MGTWGLGDLGTWGLGDLGLGTWGLGGLGFQFPLKEVSVRAKKKSWGFLWTSHAPPLRGCGLLVSSI